MQLIKLILGPFGSKLLKQDFSEKNHLTQLLNYSNTVTSYKKLEIFHASVFNKTEKTSFWDRLGSLFTQKPQSMIFPTKIVQVNFKTLCSCNFMQKIRKIMCLIS